MTFKPKRMIHKNGTEFGLNAMPPYYGGSDVCVKPFFYLASRFYRSP
jgi:hypothetical protein